MNQALDPQVVAMLENSEWSLVEEMLLQQAPPPEMTTLEWASTHRYVSKEASASPGKFDPWMTPYMIAVYHWIDDPKVKTLISMKSAQIAWTETINNAIGKTIHLDPSNIIVMFPKEGDGKDYEKEKLIPMIKATPVLAEKVNTTGSKASGNTWNRKNFPGGWLKMITSNVPPKSSVARLTVVEEPDDAADNARGQGSSIKNLKERSKTFEDAFMIFGGTPTVKGVSKVAAGYELGTQHRFLVECHECHDEHELSFYYLKCAEYADGYEHPVYGRNNPETAFYACPHCGTIWDDDQKNANVRYSALHNHFHGWAAQNNQVEDTVSVRFNELMSVFPGSSFADLMQKKLEADHKAEQGDFFELINFTNNQKGEPYEHPNENPEEDDLINLAIDYEEKTVPMGGLILTAGVDVQHDRLAVVIRAWGQDEESWLVWWGELHGAVTNTKDLVWTELDRLLFGAFQHESGASIHITAISIDSSDGNTNDAVYHWARKYKSRGVMAIKGWSNDHGDKEIFTRSKPVDARNEAKYAKYGLQLYMVGTYKSKDLIFNRLPLTGSGGGRMHTYKNVRSDYYKQVTGEIKIPSTRVRNREVYVERADVPHHEALDCEVYALHAARSPKCKVHLMRPADWDRLKSKILQADLFTTIESGEKDQKTTKQKPKNTNTRTGQSGFTKQGWGL